MLNIVKSLLFRLKKSKMYWIMLGVCALLPILLSLLCHFVIEFAKAFVDIPPNMGLEGTTYQTLTGLAPISSDINLFALLCTSIFLCKEFTDGTIRNALLSNKSRWQVYLSYAVTSLIIGGSYLMAGFVSTMLSLAIPFGFGAVTPNQAISACLCSLLLGILSMMVVVSCVLMFLFLTGKQAPSIVLPILITLFLPTLAVAVVEYASNLIMMMQMGGQWTEVVIDYTWVPFYNVLMYDSSSVDGGLVAKISLYYVVFTALFVWIGSLAARKKDLK